MDDFIGHTLGSYQIVDHLGAGAMGSVYKGYHPTMDRYVAIKVLPQHLARDGSFRARFLREARTIARLEHRYILPVYDFGEDKGVHYLVMRYVDGGTLAALLGGGRLSIERAIQVVSQIGEALGYAHQHGVIHRDIKPANVLIGSDGNIFLSDFGIAKVVEATLHLTGEGYMIGTPTYMAPEQVQSQPVDARTDIYALGILLYQAVTGEVPFVADTAISMALMHVHASPRPPRQLNPAIPEALEQAILRAIEKAPADRFQTAEAMVAALRAVPIEGRGGMAGLTWADAATLPHVSSQTTHPLPSGESRAPASIAAEAPSQRGNPPAASQPRTRPNLTLILVFAAVALLIGIVLTTLSRSSVTSSAPPATTSASRPATPAPVVVSTAKPQPTTIPTAKPQPTTIPTAIPAPATAIPKPPAVTLLRTLSGGTEWLPGVAFSPDGQTVAGASFGGIVQLWGVQDGTLLQTLKGHTNWVWSVAFSPDGHIVASASEDGTVKLWDANSGALLHTLTGHSGTVGSVAFFPDGQTLASASKDQTIKLWRVTDGLLLHTLVGHAGFVRSVAVSPDGQTVASASDDNTVKLWRASDGAQLRTLEGHTDHVYAVAFSPNGRLLASGSVDQTVRFWQVSDGTLVRTLTGHGSTVNSVTFSPNGQLLASASYDRTIKLWRVSDGILLHTLGGHTGWVFSVAFSPDGTLLASASQDQTINIWEVQQ
jgi:WD40 repeat protein